MKIIGLVASNNGLGHARRLLNLSSGFLKAGQSIKLFISRDQRIKLSSELAKMNLDLNIIEIESYGIDGPVWFKQGQLVSEPPLDVVAEIAGCDFIISDNLTWPFKYNENIAIFGHFTWHDYWQRTKDYEDLKLLEIFETKGIQSCVLRLFNVYGTRQDFSNLKQGMVSIYASYIVKGLPIIVKGSMQRFRDFIHVDDVIAAILICLKCNTLRRDAFHRSNASGISIPICDPSISSRMKK